MEHGGLKFFRLTLLALLSIQLVSLLSFAQSYTGDARRIGMGGTADNENLASRMIADQQRKCLVRSVRSAHSMPIGPVR